MSVIVLSDVGVELLEVVSRNAAANKTLSSQHSGCSEDDCMTNVFVRKLDWSSAELETG